MTTLQWTEKFLKQYVQEETSTWQEVTAVTDLLRFHATLLPDSANKRLDDIEKKVQSLEQDYLLGQMGKRK